MKDFKLVYFKTAVSLIVLSILLNSFKSLKSQNDSSKHLKELRLKVLKKNIIGKNFEYNLTKKSGCNKTKLTYLGLVITQKNKKYKFLNSFFVTGYSCRGISRLIIYDTNNVYLGNYKFDMPTSLPNKLEKNHLIFKENNLKIKNKKETSISFQNGLPQNFILLGVLISFRGDE